MRKTNYLLYLLWLFLGAGTLASCGGNDDNPLLFSLEDDRKMGEQTAHQVDSIYDGRVLSPNDFPQAYQYLENVKNQILSSDKIRYKNEFTWQTRIIKDDTTLNAFATPGGYIYVYTGLIKYLESGDHFAGVLGHEIAHADRRHTSQALQREYGISALLSIVTGGNPGLLSQVTATLLTLKYSRSAEAEADSYSVEYLADTPFACNGAAGFFQKLLDQGQGGGTPAFLSTHPAPASRVQDINAKADQVGCSKTPTSDSDYAAFKASLPD